MPADRAWQHHPLHPAVVHLPIGCWVLAAAADLAAAVLPGLRLPGLEAAALGHALLWIGVVSALPAMAAGAIDYVRAPNAVRDDPLLLHHVGWMAAAWCLWLLAGLVRTDSAFNASPALAVLGLELVASIALVIGGTLAGRVLFTGR